MNEYQQIKMWALWYQQLENQYYNLNESKSTLLNQFEQKFNYKQLYSNKFDYDISTNNINDMFDVLNTLVFNSKLPKHDVMCLNNNQIQAIFNKYHNPQHAKDLYAAYFPLPNWKAISINTPNQKPPLDFLIINTSFGKMTFAFVLNSLCHEMIHYYDMLFGDVLYKALMAFKTKTPFNPHSTKIFNKFMNTLNKDCLTIIPDDGNFNFQELNDLSVYRLKKLQEMDSDLMSGKINKPNENTLSRMSVIDGELIGVVM